MKKTRTVLVTVLLMVGGFLLTTTTWAPARPDAPPHSVLAALQNIHDALVDLNGPREPIAAEPNAVVVEGYCECMETAEDSNQAVFTVALDKQFVLRKLYVIHKQNSLYDYWHLAAGDNVLIDGSVINTGGARLGIHDFPDNCVIVDAGETLRIVNEMDVDGTYILKTTMIGYFRDTQ